MKSNEIYNNWSKHEKLNMSAIKFGIFSEKLLSETIINTLFYYIISAYLFLIELLKHLSLIQTFILSKSTKILFPSIQYLLEFILLEKYIPNEYTNFSTIIVSCLLGIQFIIVLYLTTIFYFHGKKFFNISYRFQQMFINFTRFLLLAFPYSFSYLNLNIFFNLTVRDSLTLSLYIMNLICFILFHYNYLTFIYLYNDISPTKNRYFFSVTNPIYHVLYFFRFFLYNLLLTTTNQSSKHLIFVWITIFYLVFTFQYTVLRVYFIHRLFYYIELMKTLFVITTLLFNISFFHFGFDIIITRYYILAISILICLITIPIIQNIRINHVYSIEKLNDNVIFSDEILNEMYLYHLLCKKGINYNDIFKHKKLCSLFPLEDCICRNNIILDISNQDMINHIKLNTCLFISKLNKFSNNVDQIYINMLLDIDQTHESLFLYYLNFPVKKISHYKHHLVIRNLDRFHDVFVEFYNSSQNSEQKIKIMTVSEILAYEDIFRNFLKNIKKTKNLCSNFWEIVKNKPINKTGFFKYGMEISQRVISIGQDFGKMQTIHPNKIKLLKTYTHFIKAVLHDKEYVLYLSNLIKENQHMMKFNDYNICNYKDKEFGILVISCSPKNLLKIVSYNKFSKQFFTKKVSLKNKEVHSLLPFPFNLIHKTYLKNLINNSFLSKEKELFCLDHKGDLSFINAITIPVVNFNGNIWFYLLFYIPQDFIYSNTAFVDTNGNVFASTSKFKEEFNLKNNYDFENNSKFFHEYSKLITYDNLHFFQNFNYPLIDNDNEDTYPNIYNLIEETKSILQERTKNNSTFERKKDYYKLNIIQKRNSVFEVSSVNEILYSKGFLRTKKTQFSSKHVKRKTESSKLNINDSADKNYFSSNSHKEIHQNSNLIHNLVILKNNQKHEIEIKENTSLSGFFKYYSINLKIPHNNLFSLSSSNAAINLRSKNMNMLECTTIDKEKKISLYLTKYQNNTTFYSPSKIFKKIYYFYGLIFIMAIITSVYISLYNLNEYSNNSKNSKVFDGFLFINSRIVMMLMNVEYLAYYRYSYFHNHSTNLQEKINYTKNSLKYDLNSLENFLQGFIKEDLSSSIQFQDSIKSQSLQISHLSKDYTISYSNYTLYQALNIYLVEIKTFLNEEESETNYFRINEVNAIADNFEKCLFFINDNYSKSIRIILEQLTLSKIDALINDISRNSVFFNFQNIVFCAVFSVILGLLFIILRDVYLIDSSLIYFYSRLDDLYIDNFNDYLKLSFFVTDNYENEESKFNKISKKNLKKIYKIDKYELIYNNEFNRGNERKKPSTINSEKGFITSTIECHTHDKFLSSNDNLALFKHINNTESKVNFKNKDKDDEEKDFWRLYRIGIDKNFYMKKFIRAMLLVVSLSYFYFIQVFVHPHSSTSVENYLLQQFTFQRKIILNHLLVESLLTSIRINSTLIDNNKELFHYYYDQLLEVNYNSSFLLKDKYLYNSEIIQKLKDYNSLHFCDYFFNTSYYERTILLPKESYINCNSSPVYFGIDIYFSQFKNSLDTIFSSFNNNRGSIDFLKDLIEEKSIQFAHIGLGFYSRQFSQDIIESFMNSLNTIIITCNLYVEVSLVSFIIQLCVYSVFIYFYYKKDLHIHFEKKRILFSILPRDNSNKIWIQINNILNRYF